MYTKIPVAILFIAFFLQPIAPAYANENSTAADAPSDVAEEGDVVEDSSETSSQSNNTEEQSSIPGVDQIDEQEPIDEVVAEESDDVKQVTVETEIKSTSSPSSNQESAEGDATDDSFIDNVTQNILEDKSTTTSQSSDTTASSTTKTSASSTSSVSDVPSETEYSEDVNIDSATSSTEVSTSTLPTNGTQEPEVPEAETQIEPETSTPEPAESGHEFVDDDKSNEENNGEVLGTTTQTTDVVHVLANSENRHQFGETECVSVGDDAFYCTKSTGVQDVEKDGVYVATDSDGDREIFMRKNGETVQITNNLEEDAAPQYDETDEQIVFHRLIEGRYQIIRYDLDTGREEQITSSRENNMEPSQRDGITVWQRWVEDNWDIAMLRDGETTIISTSRNHDVAPTVRDGYVMWHTTNEQGDKLLSVYEITTGISSTIADPDGGHVENPRFVLVYDTKFENGDVVTKQYDPETGEILPVSAIPAPLPVELPETDSTGETRALIQNKTSSSKEELIDISPETGSSTPSTSPGTGGTSIASSTSDGTHSESDTSTAATTLDLASTTEEVLPLDEYDLIVEPYEPAPTSTNETTSSSTVVLDS